MSLLIVALLAYAVISFLRIHAVYRAEGRLIDLTYKIGLAQIETIRSIASGDRYEYEQAKRWAVYDGARKRLNPWLPWRPISVIEKDAARKIQEVGR